MDDIITRLKWSAGRHTQLSLAINFPNGSHQLGPPHQPNPKERDNKQKNKKCMYIEVYTEGDIFNLQPFTGIITLAKEECDPPIG